MQAWEYRVAYVDFRGRVSIEGEEISMERGERRSAFVRSVLDRLGQDGWELVGVHPLWPAETSYMVFKRPASREQQGGNEPKLLPETEGKSGDQEQATRNLFTEGPISES